MAITSSKNEQKEMLVKESSSIFICKSFFKVTPTMTEIGFIVVSIHVKHS